MSPAMPEPRPARKVGGRLWPPQRRGRRATPHLAAARGPDAAAAAAMALSSPCPGTRSSAAIPPTRAARRRSRAASRAPPRSGVLSAAGARAAARGGRESSIMQGLGRRGGRARARSRRPFRKAGQESPAVTEELDRLHVARKQPRAARKQRFLSINKYLTLFQFLISESFKDMLICF